jgi:hypothetical protein
MNTPENFINWLEGFLDACKNKPTAQQIKEIRKKISDLRSTNGEMYTALWNSQVEPSPVKAFPTITLVQPGVDVPNNGSLDEEFMAEIERKKSASTLDELFEEKN